MKTQRCKFYEEIGIREKKWKWWKRKIKKVEKLSKDVKTFTVDRK